MFKMIRTVADRALLVLMALPLSALAATEDFSSATWTNHQDLGTEVVINDLNIAVPSGASMKGVTVPAAIQIGYDPTRVATSVTISPASQWDRLNVSAITLTDLFQMPVPGVKLIGLLKGQQVAYAEADSLWTDGSGATTVSLTGFNNIDELKITGDVADETNSDVFFFIESLDYQLIAVPPEIVVILDSAGDAANTITAEQLNAVDGVSGALEANEPFYREEVARLSVDDLDTAAEIQTLVDGVNRSVASVPVADIPASVSVVEGDEVAVAVTATDSNNDPLSYSLQAGSPAWLSIDNFASYTTTLADTGDFEVNPDNAAEQSSARGVARDSLGNIYFAVTDFRSGYKGAVAKIATDGSVSILAGSAFFNPTITTNFEYIYSVAVDGNGNVYAADVSLKKVFKISGNTVTEFLTNVNSKGMVFANDGYLYVSNSNQVLKVNTAGVVEQTFSNITDPYGLDVDSSGNIYVASEINRVVYKVTAAGDVSVYAGIERARGSDDGISGTFRSPTDVALDQSTGELYVTDATNHLIRKVATDGTVSTIAGTARASGTEDGLDAKFNNPAGLLMTATGDLIITDKNSGRIRHLSLKDNLGLSGIAPDPTGASESFQALINIDDGFGNTTVHTLNVTVLDAELDVITNAAGDRFNQVTDVQLNAVDGVSGALVANEAQYQAVIAGLTAEDLDTAAEIQALVNSVNSVPVFTSATTVTALEGDAFSWSFVATDSANDALIFAVKTGTTPSAWMTLSAAGVLTGTPLDADVGLHNITVEVSDGFGNTVEQTLAITVLDAEIDAVASVAGVTNGITATELNAVEGVTGALSENNAKYQAAIAALTSEDLDSAAEIQTLVNSVNSVPQFVSEGTLRVNTGERAELVLSAVDAGDDEVTFSLAEGSVLPSWLTLAYRISPLPAGFTVGEPSLIPALVPLPISDKTSASLIAAPSASDYGTYQVTLVAEDGFGNSGTQLVTVIVNAPGQLSISGEAAVGQTLSASVYDANNIDSTISYSWMSEATEVSQAQSYVVQASDLGNLIALQVTYTDADTTLETLSSISDIIIGAEENAFNNIADQVGSRPGRADTDDYLAAGVTSVDAQTLDRILPILNAAVGQQEDAGDVDSAAEIEALIATIMEGQDYDCDGLPNMLEGIADTDGDGIIDRNDTDADNDGIRDNLEYGSLMTSSIRLDAAIVVDRDSSELTSAVDDPVSTCSLLGDSDRDGIIDFFDISPYGDGKVRSAAFVGTLEAEAVDENLDGVRDDRDSKEEFIAALDALIVTSVEDESRIISPAAFLPIRVVYNVTADVDSDGLINSLDLDADNDGVIDLIEAGHSDDDTNGLLDEGTDLIEDAEALVDSDADGIPDFLQLKSDGVTFDLIKAGILSSLDGNNDGRIDSLTDVDLDGLMDVIDNAIGFFGSLEDFDGDGIPNHLDDDDDGDGIPDREENDQFSFFTGEDADGDGIDDGIDALINGIIQGLDTNNNGVLDDRELADLDGDGIADYLDIDADGDGIRDDLDDLIELFVEEGPSQAPVLDADGDGVLDSEDVSVNSGADVKAGGAISTAFYMLILTILAFTARARRTLVAFVMMFGLVAQANAGALSVEGGVGFARFDPDLQITPSESDTLDAGASIGVGAHLNDELGLTLSYFNLGDASINTARISYRATSLALQYRPSFARAGGWALQVEALGSDIDMSSEKGLQVDDSDEIVMGFGLGADYQVNDAERIELMFNRLSSDVDFFSVSYRLLFEI
ncbi:MAG: putative Ig domain-containing protein [Thalassolituus sp.]|jgi:hypothetical protein